MKIITINICLCGMRNRNFKKNIMIYKPRKIIRKNIIMRKRNKNAYIKDIIMHNCDQIIFSYTDFSDYNIYIYFKKFLLKVTKDITLIELFNYFSTNKINIYIFLILGGASIEFRGYEFTIHSDESVHKNTPHVHVCKNGSCTRYSLVTFERFKNDKVSKEIKKAEKKIIIPFIKNNIEDLMALWNHNVNGFETPILNEKGQQFYDES